jgi:Leucine-rich repeat (LRR) protein
MWSLVAILVAVSLWSYGEVLATDPFSLAPAAAPTSRPTETKLNLPTIEYNALYDLYNATNGPNWNWRTVGEQWNFTGSHNPCSEEWQGIECSLCVTTCNVIAFSLANYSMSGTLPSSIGSFAQVDIVHFDANDLVGPIPTEIGLLSSVGFMELSSNYFSSTLPTSICGLSLVYSFYCADNLLSGPIPFCISDMTTLNDFFAADNALSSSLPLSLADMTALQQIGIGSNALTGIFEVSIGGSTWANMIGILVPDNYFSGPLPTQMQFWTSLHILYAQENLFSNTIPSIIDNMDRLKYFYVHSNSISGTIPSQFASMEHIAFIDVSNNRLVSTLPRQLCFKSDLIEIFAAANYLTSTIPTCISNASSLSNFNITGNLMSGVIPEALTDVTIMTALYLSSNYFTNSLPSNVNAFRVLKYLDISNNFLSGAVDLAGISILLALYLASNLFTGTLDNVCNMTSARNNNFLTNLDVSNNHFVGSIPPEIFYLPELQTFAAVSNCFSGSLPSSICTSPSLTVAALDGLSASSSCHHLLFPHTSSVYFPDNLVDMELSVFKCILELPFMEAFYFAGNSLQSAFPEGVDILSSRLSTLVMSHNQLSGSIPSYIFQNYWLELDLSYNRLTGHLSPMSVSTESAVSLSVNRLSGPIPGTVQELDHVDVLTDNMFSCDVGGSDLPTNDSSASNYSCGSDNLNGSLAIWLVLFIIFSSVVYWFCGLDFMSQDICSMLVISDFSTKYSNYASIISSFRIFENQQAFIRKVVGRMMFTIILVFLPTYGILSLYYSTYQDKYGWVVSALFNAGEAPASIILAFLSIFCMRIYTVVKFSGRNSDLNPATERAVSRQSTIQAVTSTVDWLASYCYLLDPFLILVLIADLVIIGGATVGYILVIVYRSHSEAIVYSVFIALLKTFWNGPVLKAAINAIRDFQKRKVVIEDNNDPTERPDIQMAAVSTDKTAPGIDSFTINAIYASQSLPENLIKAITPSLSSSTMRMLDTSGEYDRDLRFRVFLGILNSIILPCVTTAFLSPSCFYNLIIPSPDVEATYSARLCTDSVAGSRCTTVAANVTTMFLGSGVESTIYFSTPFVYSYQCSSIVIKSFAPVFISSAIISSFLIPGLSLLSEWLLNRYHEEHAKPSQKLERLLEKATFIFSVSKPKSKALQMMDDFLTMTNKGQSDSVKIRTLVDHGSLFRKDSYLVAMINSLAVLITFGVIVPLIGIVVSASIIIHTLVADYKTAQLVKLFKQNDFYFGIDLMGKECTSLSRTLASSILMILIIANAFWSFLVFDIYGSSIGFRRAIFVILWVLFPVCVHCVAKYIWRKMVDFDEDRATASLAASSSAAWSEGTKAARGCNATWSVEAANSEFVRDGAEKGDGIPDETAEVSPEDDL